MKYKYLIRDIDRHGNERLYYRARGQAKVRIYADADSPGFAAAYQAARNGTPLPKPVKRNWPRKEPAYTAGVYVISSGPATVKIGLANDPVSRLCELQVGSHKRLTLEFYIRCDDIGARLVEKAAHDIFASKRVSGEWFRLRVAEAITEIVRLVTHRRRQDRKKP